MNIHGFADKIKGWGGEKRQILTFTAILILTAGISFYLGYVARAESAHASPVAINCPLEAYINNPNAPISPKNGVLSPENAQNAPMSVNSGNAEIGQFVASKNGSKYYPVACSGAKRIKDENKVFFTSEAAAQNAGYGLAANCK